MRKITNGDGVTLDKDQFGLDRCFDSNRIDPKRVLIGLFFVFTTFVVFLTLYYEISQYNRQIESAKGLFSHITQFYANMFGSPLDQIDSQELQESKIKALISSLKLKHHQNSLMEFDGETFLVSRVIGNHIMILYSSGPAMPSSIPIQEEVEVSSQMAFKQNSGCIEELSFQHQKVISCFSYIVSLDVAIVIKIDKNKLIRPLISELFQHTIYILILIIVGIIAVFRLTQKMKYFIDDQDKKIIDARQDVISSQLIYKGLIESSPIGLILLSDSGQILNSNTYVLKLFRYRNIDDILGKDITVIFPEESKKVFISKFESYREEAQNIALNFNSELHGLSHNNKSFPINVILVRFEVDKKVYYSVALRDISIETMLNKIVSNHSHFLEMLIDAIPGAMYYKSRDGHFMGCNEHFAQLVGVSKKELIGMSVEDLPLDDSKFNLNRLDLKILQDGETKGYEATIHSPWGPRDYEIIKSRFYQMDSHVTGIIAMITDVTEKRKNDRELRILGTAIQKTSDTLIVVDALSGEIVLTNQDALNESGYGKNELMGMKIWDLEIKDIQENDWKEFVDQMRMSGNRVIESTCQRKDQEKIPMEINITYIKDKQLEFIIYLCRNISERLKAQEDHIQNQLMQSEKLATIGEMAAGIVHEIKNPLSAISLTNKIIKKKLKQLTSPPTDLLTFVIESESMVDRITRIINGLQNLSRNNLHETFDEVILKDIIDDTLILTRSKLMKLGITLTIDENPVMLEKIECLRIQLSQVFINLINNASDAIEKFEDKWIRIDISKKDNLYVFHFIDSGEGIPFDLQENLFKAFFTTKALGKGTGLGLSLSNTIVKRHNGRLYVNNNFKNTCFTVEIPLKQGSFS